MEITYTEWEKKSPVEMTHDMLVMDTVSCVIVALTMPAFTAAFFVLGYMIIKVL